MGFGEMNTSVGQIASEDGSSINAIIHTMPNLADAVLLSSFAEEVSFRFAKPHTELNLKQ